MFGNGGHTVGAAGDLKAPHAFGIHAAQVLPLLAWLLLFTSLRARTQWLVTALAVVGSVVMVVAAAAQAFSGRPPQDVAGIGMFGVGGMALVAVGYVVAAVGLWQAGQRPVAAQPR